MTGVSSDIKFQALHEHYKDTFLNIKESIKLRDKLVILVLLVLALVVLYTFWPADAITAFSQITAQKIGIAISVDGSFLGSIIWFALLAAIVRYTQVVIYIERQYAYIHHIEEELQKNYDCKIIFTREGKSYLNKYPLFSDWICLLYTTIFPLVLISVVLSKITSEWIDSAYNFSFPLLLNSALAISILVSIILYMLFMRKQK
ncbi:MAG: hypothetical protein WCG28_03225 [bacterium]